MLDEVFNESIEAIDPGLTEIGVAGVQQAWQTWRAWRGVARSSILTSVYDSCISILELLNCI